MAANLPLVGQFADREYIFVVVLGLWIGALIGAMAQIVPYGLFLLSAIVVSVLAFRQDGSSSLIVILVGLLAGSAFGSMSSVVPFGVTIFLALTLAVMLWKTQGGGMSIAGPTSAIALVLYIIVSVGFLFNGTNLDFCNPTLTVGFNACLNPSSSGYITAYQGCINNCAITAFTFLGNSPLAFLLTGDFVGFITSLFTGAQSAFNGGNAGNFFWSIIAGIVTAVTGAILVFLGSGIGIQASVVASGGSLTPNEAGTRTAQSFGIGLLLWSALTTLIFGFGQFFGYLGFGLGSGTGVGAAGGGAIYITFLMYYVYQLYLQGKTITE
jgi:hypothetical protein